MSLQGRREGSADDDQIGYRPDNRGGLGVNGLPGDFNAVGTTPRTPGSAASGLSSADEFDLIAAYGYGAGSEDDPVSPAYRHER